MFLKIKFYLPRIGNSGSQRMICGALEVPKTFSGSNNVITVTLPLYLHFSFFFKIIHLFTCAYIGWVISPPCPSPPLLPPSPLLPGRNCSALISNLVEKKT
jgi:hypothetical protein